MKTTNIIFIIGAIAFFAIVIYSIITHCIEDLKHYKWVKSLRVCDRVRVRNYYYGGSSDYVVIEGTIQSISGRTFELIYDPKELMEAKLIYGKHGLLIRTTVDIDDLIPVSDNVVCSAKTFDETMNDIRKAYDYIQKQDTREQYITINIELHELDVIYTFSLGDPGNNETAPLKPDIEIHKVQYMGIEISDLLFELTGCAALDKIKEIILKKLDKTV